MVRTVTRTKAAPARPQHPHSVPILSPEALGEALPDQPFAENVVSGVDPEVRYRMISEAAYRRYSERGYVDGYDLEDWLDAEIEVDHLLLNPTMPESEVAS
jgi:hypothetical protein